MFVVALGCNGFGAREWRRFYVFFKGRKTVPWADEGVFTFENSYQYIPFIALLYNVYHPLDLAQQNIDGLTLNIYIRDSIFSAAAVTNKPRKKMKK